LFNFKDKFKNQYDLILAQAKQFVLLDRLLADQVYLPSFINNFLTLLSLLVAIQVTDLLVSVIQVFN
jgi:hypothetical protein